MYLRKNINFYCTKMGVDKEPKEYQKIVEGKAICRLCRKSPNGYMYNSNNSMLDKGVIVPDNKSRNIPEVVFVRRWAVGVLGIWREGVGWERGG